MSEFPELLRNALKFPKFKIVGYKQAVKLKTWNDIEYRKWMRGLSDRVHIYRLTPDFMWAVTQVMFKLDPYDLYQEALAARMPFECVAFEYDVTQKTAMLTAQGIPVEEDDPVENQRPIKSWTTVTTDSTSKARIVTTFSIGRDALLCQFPAVTMIDVRGGLLKGFMDWLFSSPCCDKYPDSIAKIKADNRLGFGVMGPVGEALKAISNADRYDRFYRILYEGTGGEFRFYAAICALMNRSAAVRTIELKVLDRPEAKHEKRTGSQHDLVLMLPREKVVNLVVNPRKPRGELTEAHAVSGHWAHFHASDKNGCDHQWPNEPTRRQRCLKCKALRWWKADHKRGPGEVKSRDHSVDYSGSGLSLEHRRVI